MHDTKVMIFIGFVHRCLSDERPQTALVLLDFPGDEAGQLTIDILLIGVLAGPREVVGTIADEEFGGFAPLRKL